MSSRLVMATRHSAGGGIDAEPVVAVRLDDGGCSLTLDDGESLVFDAVNTGELVEALTTNVLHVPIGEVA